MTALERGRQIEGNCTMLITMLCRGLLAVTGHRLCCARIPEWTAHVGQRWDTYDVARWNLYNVLWRGQQLLLSRAG